MNEEVDDLTKNCYIKSQISKTDGERGKNLLEYNKNNNNNTYNIRNNINNKKNVKNNPSTKPDSAPKKIKLVFKKDRFTKKILNCFGLNLPPSHPPSHDQLPQPHQPASEKHHNITISQPHLPPKPINNSHNQRQSTSTTFEASSDDHTGHTGDTEVDVHLSLDHMEAGAHQ